MSRSGFTLVEVVVALLVLEIAVVCLVGTLVLASSTLTRAETLERVVSAAEGVLDSIGRAPTAGSDSALLPNAHLSWSVDDSGRVRVHAVDAAGRVLVEVESMLAP